MEEDLLLQGGCAACSSPPSPAGVVCTWKSRRAWSSFMSTFIILRRRCTSLKFMRPSLFLSAFWNQSRIHVRETGADVKGKDRG